ncbi:hypothetical protein QAD02_023888, partial [Eretmocerus hayati]
SGGAWSRGGRGRPVGRGRGSGPGSQGGTAGGSSHQSGLGGSNTVPQIPGHPPVGPGLLEVVNILGERNTRGRLLGVSPPPGAIVEEPETDDEEAERNKGPPKPLLRRLIEYVREAWTGVKFALADMMCDIDSEYEEEQIPRYRPDSLKSLCRATRFTEAEMKRIYRGFKAQCPTGVVREENFKIIYSQFFPQG